MKTKDLALLVNTVSFNNEENLCTNIGCVLFCAQSITQDVSGSHNKLGLSEISFFFYLLAFHFFPSYQYSFGDGRRKPDWRKVSQSCAYRTPGRGKKKKSKMKMPHVSSNASWFSSHTEQLSHCRWYHRTHRNTRWLILPTFQLGVSQYTTLNPSSSSALVCGSDWIMTHM